VRALPTYQYRCIECGQPLEAVQRITDAALTECPQCGGRLRKVFPAVGVVFKGSGFYRTDSRSATKEKETAPSGSNGASSDAAKTPAESSSNGSKSKATAAASLSSNSSD
jgi:putative FmdB family regulatory protein